MYVRKYYDLLVPLYLVIGLPSKASGLQKSMHPWKVWIQNLKKRETLPDY